MDNVTALKGSVLRSYVAAMRQRNIFDPVYAMADTELRARMDFPPVSVEWVPAQLTTRLSEHLVAVLGRDETRSFALDANRTGLFAILRPMIQGALAVGGGTPHTLFSRIQYILRAQVRGYDYAYSETDATSGVLTMVIHGVRESRGSLATWEGGLELVFTLFPGSGSVRATEVTFENDSSIVRFDIRWRNA